MHHVHTVTSQVCDTQQTTARYVLFATLKLTGERGHAAPFDSRACRRMRVHVAVDQNFAPTSKITLRGT
ncbi:hypothetical protein XPN_1604 [Xanthomonas arboricola pv. pruni MAFF 301427]|nr:hypothetical protein XPN_1604 [Xanthomonas arboricola pv. pruni MAFF 301427]